MLTGAERAKRWRENNREKYLEQKRNEYKRNKDKHRAATKQKVVENRLMCREHLGGKCVSCGVVDNLEIDHKYPQDKTINMSAKMGSTNLIKEELKVCQLLCEKCHREKSSKERRIAHKLLMSLSHQQFDMLMDDYDVNVDIKLD